MDGHELEIHYAEEWAALYVDGKLLPETVGDSYLAEEKAFNLLGVKQLRDDAFMRGQTGRGGVARTLDEVNQFKADREARRMQAKKLRDEALRLTVEADKLDAESW